jgi:hypothetical protein
MNTSTKIVLSVIALLASHSAALFIGTRSAIARGAYVNAMAVKQEETCWTNRDIECYRVSWHLRAAATASGANIGLKTPVPSGVDSELEEYLGWYQKLAPYTPPAK